MGLPFRDPFPVCSRTSRGWRFGSGHFDSRALEHGRRREQRPRVQPERLSQPFHRLNREHSLPARFEPLVKFEGEASDLGHLLLRKIRTQAKSAEVFGKKLSRRHCPS